MKRLFAVIRSHGPTWNHSKSLEEQEGWQSHAAFMDALEAEAFVVVGGPLEGTPNVLLVIRANDEEEIRRRLAEDPWTHSELLKIVEIRPWTLRLGRLR